MLTPPISLLPVYNLCGPRMMVSGIVYLFFSRWHCSQVYAADDFLSLHGPTSLGLSLCLHILRKAVRTYMFLKYLVAFIYLAQWFLTREDSVCQEALGNIWRHFWSSQLGKKGAPGIWRVETRDAGQCPTGPRTPRISHPDINVSSVRLRPA